MRSPRKAFEHVSLEEGQLLELDRLDGRGKSEMLRERGKDWSI